MSHSATNMYFFIFRFRVFSLLDLEEGTGTPKRKKTTLFGRKYLLNAPTEALDCKIVRGDMKIPPPPPAPSFSIPGSPTGEVYLEIIS